METSPGPCTTHVAVGVGVRVGVEDGVNVAVGVKVWVAVAVSVGGRGVDVEAGNVAETGIPPQAVNSRIIPSICNGIFFMILYGMIDVPQYSQAIEGEPGCDDLDDIGFLRYNFCQPAGGDHFHAGSEFFAEALDHAFHHADIAIQ